MQVRLAASEGAIDDRPRVQAAIDAVVAGGGGTVLFETGTYSLGGHVRVPASNVRLEGERGAVLKLAAGANSAVVVFAADPHPSQLITDCEITQLEIDGNCDNQTARGTGPYESVYDNSGILAVGTDRFRVHGCYVHDTWATGVDVNRSRSARITDNYLFVVGANTSVAIGARNAISVYGNVPGQTTIQSRRHIVSGNIIRSFRDVGIDVAGNGTDGAVIVGNSVEGAANNWGIALEIHSADNYDTGKSAITGNVVRDVKVGIVLESVGGHEHCAVAVTGNVVTDTQSSGILMMGSHISCVGNVVNRHGLDTTASSGSSSGIAFSTNTGLGLTFSDCTISANSINTTEDQPGIQVGTFGSDVIDGIVISGNALEGFGSGKTSAQGQGIRVVNARRVTVSGNTVRKYEQGIGISNSRVVVSGNVCAENNDNGIRLSTAPGPVVTGNQCTNNGARSTASYRSGILVGVSTTDAVVSDNVCTDDQATKTQQYGVRADAGGTANVGTGTVTGGKLDGNAVAAVFPGPGLVVHDVGGGPAVTTKTATYTVVLSDRLVLVDASAGAVTINLPTAVGITSFQVSVKRIDATLNAVLIDPNGTQTIDDAPTKALVGKDTVITVVSDGANWRVSSYGM